MPKRPPLKVKNKGEKVLRPVHPNAGITADYRKRLTRLIDELHASVMYWVKAAYNQNSPEITQDASPAAILRAAIRRLTRRWQTKFDGAAKKLGAYFAKAVSDRSDAVLKTILKDAGISIEWTMTAAQNDILQATIAQQVGLIKSIPQQYLGKVEGMVMRSVQTGRDLGQLAKDLEGELGVTKRRAAFIARSQNNIATASLTRARQIEIGVDKAVWVHSGGGRTQRPEHVKAGRDKLQYDVAKGAFLEGVWTWPGVQPNCRCVSRSVIQGFS